MYCDSRCAVFGVYLFYDLMYNSFPRANPLEFAFVGGSNFGAAMLVAPLVTSSPANLEPDPLCSGVSLHLREASLPRRLV